MKTEYDIVIAGAGPAGLTAAKTIIESGIECTLLVIEKSNNYADSVKCGEGSGKHHLNSL